MDIEQKLKKLFDFQLFEQNDELEKMIRKTEAEYENELTDEELSQVFAAGEVYCNPDYHNFDDQAKEKENGQH